MNPVWSRDMMEGKATTRRLANNLDIIFKSSLSRLIGRYEPHKSGSLSFFKSKEIHACFRDWGSVPEL